MGKIFGYDSKALRFLGRVSDLLFLNMLFILCCIPIFTIGAAQAGQYRAVLAMQDPDSDYTWPQAFFMGFKDGFWNITIASMIMLVLIYFVAMNSFAVIFFEQATKDTNSIVWLCPCPCSIPVSAASPGSCCATVSWCLCLIPCRQSSMPC